VGGGGTATWARLVKANGTLAVQVSPGTAPSFSPARPRPLLVRGQQGRRPAPRPLGEFTGRGDVARRTSSHGIPGGVAAVGMQPLRGKTGLIAAATVAACWCPHPFRPRRPVPGAPPASLEAPFSHCLGRLDATGAWSFVCFYLGLVSRDIVFQYSASRFYSCAALRSPLLLDPWKQRILSSVRPACFRVLVLLRWWRMEIAEDVQHIRTSLRSKQINVTLFFVTRSRSILFLLQFDSLTYQY
jgi:hypothetical protein